MTSHFYAQYPDGTLVACQNYATAKYLVDIGDAIKVIDMTRTVLPVKQSIKK